MSKTIRCCRTTLLLVAAIFVLGSATAFAQHTTGFNMAKTCPTTVASGANFFCSVTIANRDVDHGVINLTLTNQVPFPSGPTTALTCFQPFDATECDNGGPTGTAVTELGTATSLTAGCGACIAETAPINCDSNNISYVDEVRATGTDAAPAGSPFFNLPVSSATTNATPVAPNVCNDNDACTNDTCDVNAVGGCTFTPVDCNDNDACTADSCVGGVCQHAPLDCNDNDACTSDSCVAGACVNTPIDCNDNDTCTSDSCVAGACVNTPVDCNDNDACTTDSCVGGVCQHDALDCNDNDACTIDSCVAGVCQHDPSDAPECNNEEVCRTPGFWGTHGGSEKGGPNLTQAVLNETGPLSICGGTISTTNTDPLTNTSALEAICVSPKGTSALQLARQLTAAALNCGVTNSTGCGGAGQSTTGNICAGVSIADTFEACNTLCADPTATQADIGACIDALDCFNNGGTGLEGGVCVGDSGCHDRNGAGCIDLSHPGPASSPKLCNTARKDDIVIIP